MYAILNLTFLYINWDLQEYCFHRLVNAMLKVGLLFLFANLGHIGI